MSGKFTLESFFRIYDDRTGDFVEVREDRDSLGLIEIQQGTHSVVIPLESVSLLVEALGNLSSSLAKRTQDPA